MRLLLVRAVAATAVALTPILAFGDDQQIADSIMQRLAQEKNVGHLRDFGVNVEVDAGTVFLSGRVANQQQQSLVLETARRVDGVKQVVTDLEVKTTASSVPAPPLPGAKPQPTQPAPAAAPQQQSQGGMFGWLPRFNSPMGNAAPQPQPQQLAANPAKPKSTMTHPPVATAPAPRAQVAAAKPAPQDNRVTRIPPVTQPASHPALNEVVVAPSREPLPRTSAPAKQTAPSALVAPSQSTNLNSVAAYYSEPSEELVAPAAVKPLDQPAPKMQLVSNTSQEQAAPTLPKPMPERELQGPPTHPAPQQQVAQQRQQPTAEQLQYLQAMQQQQQAYYAQMVAYQQYLAQAQAQGQLSPQQMYAMQQMQLAQRQVPAQQPQGYGQPMPGQHPMYQQVANNQPMSGYNPVALAGAPLALAANHMQGPAPVAAGGPVPASMGGQIPSPGMYYMPTGGNATPPQYDHPQMPAYAWPAYAAHPNYAAVTVPKQYSPSAWPYIGPFYPYPQVPLGWRKVTLEWDDGWWMLDFRDH